MVQRDLIYDLGMFEGQDAAFYMSKGFRVISLEANPELCERNSQKYAREIADGRLTIVPKALWHEAGSASHSIYIRAGVASITKSLRVRIIRQRRFKP